MSETAVASSVSLKEYDGIEKKYGSAGSDETGPEEHNLPQVLHEIPPDTGYAWVFQCLWRVFDILLADDIQDGRCEQCRMDQQYNHHYDANWWVGREFDYQSDWAPEYVFPRHGIGYGWVDLVLIFKQNLAARYNPRHYLRVRLVAHCERFAAHTSPMV
ncbi:hypothetical protein AYI68_g6025 [Smittium mucronatum]|uniref:Uncharacterized protein n=1 Tax=Smittium mucronatum TaxID=133383 RepID=A0A1R0GSP4_9FUNG|nr:hypothetical protein AYI68_g6025 [Smittium mucronatum]